MRPAARLITQRAITLVLLGGFGLAIVFLLGAGFLSLRNFAALHQSIDHPPQQELVELERLQEESVILLGAGLLCALACAVGTVYLAVRLSRQMEWQMSELSRVSWQMLQDQEAVAQRFSHELHDELGQSLTAVKANLVSLETTLPHDLRLRDTLSLVDDSIANVRQLSQLLRPTILDDFGLSAGLKWLAEGFQQRTGIAVTYESAFEARLLEEVETHLFRIAQEALTNVARHAHATQVGITLAREGSTIHLRITDNGAGIQAEGDPVRGLGLVGMRARARSAGGETTIHSTAGSGVTVDAVFPCQERTA